MYHEGKSELFASRVLAKYPRESYYLADKLPIWALNTEEDIDRIFNEQLDKCGVGFLDNYLMHAMSKSSFEKAIKLNVYDKLKEYKDKGKIRNLGFSFHDTPEVLEWMLNTYDWDFVQIQLNYLDWDFQNAKKQYELIEAKGIPCIIMEPVRGGALANLCPEAREILKKHSWAIRFAASLPNVLTVLSGMSDFSQVKDNIGSMSPFMPLSEQERKVLDDALEAYKKAKIIPCTGCRYCMDCPFGVDIPGVFRIVNRYSLTEDESDFMEDIKRMPSESLPNNCTDCKRCVSLCPQFIPIPEHMKRVKSIIERFKT